jgi:integrase/transcriptional regulator with XRE-family HTH domain
MLTYDELMRLVGAALRRQSAIADSAPDPQTLLNRRYQLRLMCRAAGKETSSQIGADFLDDFETLRERAVAAAPGERTKADVRRGLRWWQERYGELVRQSARGASNQPLGSLASVLRENLGAREVTHARAAAIAGVPASTLSSWLQGVIPKSTTAAGLRRLEQALALGPGTLSERVRRNPPAATPTPVSGYRNRLKALRRDRYRLQMRDAGPFLMREWQALLSHKTTKAPTLQRAKRAVWRLAPESERRNNAGPHNTVGNQYCAAADAEWKHVASYFGFLRSKAADHGLELPERWQPTLALFGVPNLVEPYCAWLVARADGVVNTRLKTLANFLQGMTVQPTGWLVQQPALADHLPRELRPEDWAAACKRVNQLATAYRAEANGMSRDPFEPIRGLLALQEPFAPIAEAVRMLDARALSAGLQSPSAATAKRDAMLLTVLLSVPLRHRNLALLRYREDGTGTLRREPDGLWWIRIPPHETKNRKAINAPLPSCAVPRLDEYVALYRPRLLGGNDSEFAFVAARQSGGPWWGVNSRLFYLTKTYLPGCVGFHTHSWRHLVATRWLDKHPEDYLTVAHLLGDELQTVIRTYSRPLPARAIGRANQDIDALMA